MKLKYLLLALLLLLTGTANATTYYFSNSGSDTNNCGSGDPCATTAKAESLSWSGNTFLFECGSTFRTPNATVLTTQGSNATLGRYGTCTGANEPIFTSAEIISGFSSAGTNLWRRSTSTAAGRNVAFDGTMAVWDETDDSGCPGSMSTDTEICYNGGYLYVYSSTDPDSRWSTIERWSMSTSAGLGIVVNHSDISGSHIAIRRITRGVQIKGATLSNVNFDHMEVAWCGWADNLGYMPFVYGWDCYAISDVETSGDFDLSDSVLHDCGRDCYHLERALPDGTITVVNNEFYNFFNHGALNLNKDMDSSDVAHGTVRVEGNSFHDGCTAAGIGDGNDGGFDNLRIIDNDMYDLTESDDSRGNPAGNACQTPNRGIAYFGSNANIELYFANNRIWDNRRGVVFRANGTGCLGLTMYNNTFYSNSDTGMEIQGSMCHTPVLRNNAWVSNGSNSTSTVCCQISCSGTSGCPTLDNDYDYFFPEAQTSSIIAHWNSSTYTLAQAESSLSWGSNNIASAYGSSPTIFQDAGGADFSPAASSILIDAGTDVGISYNGSAPDIGAIESGTVPPPTLQSCTVEAATPSNIICVFSVPTPPMLPAASCDAGWSTGGTSASITDCNRSESDTFIFDLDTAIAVTDTPTLSYDTGTGNTTDSTPTELDTVTNYTVTNNVGVNLVTADNIIATTGTFDTGREVTHMFDGDVTTQEGSSGSGSDTSFSITNDLCVETDIGLTRLYGDAVGNWICDTYDIEYSTDCTSYTTYASGLDCTGNQWWEQTLDVSARCIRLTVHGSVNGTQAFEWQVYGASSPPSSPSTTGQVGTTVTGVNIK